MKIRTILFACLALAGALRAAEPAPIAPPPPPNPLQAELDATKSQLANSQSTAQQLQIALQRDEFALQLVNANKQIETLNAELTRLQQQLDQANTSLRLEKEKVDTLLKAVGKDAGVKIETAPKK